jgi:hypothetical protein
MGPYPEEGTQDPDVINAGETDRGVVHRYHLSPKTIYFRSLQTMHSSFCMQDQVTWRVS